MKKTTAYGLKLKRLQARARPDQASAAHASPVGRAVIAKEEIDSVTELMTLMTSISIRIYFTLDGECDTKLLANLALLLGVGTEVALAFAPHHPESKRLHAALRTVVQFSVAGGAGTAVRPRYCTKPQSWPLRCSWRSQSLEPVPFQARSSWQKRSETALPACPTWPALRFTTSQRHRRPKCWHRKPEKKHD